MMKSWRSDIERNEAIEIGQRMVIDEVIKLNIKELITICKK